MPVGFRNNAGVDWENLFEPGGTAAPGYRRANGSPVAFAPRNGLPKGPNLGARDSAGVDLSSLWLPKGTAPPTPGFNGKTYSAEATQDPDGTPAVVSGRVTLLLRADGTWSALADYVGTDTPGTVTLESGTWLPAGGSAADYTVQFTPSAGTGAGVVTNGAATAAVLSTARSISLQCSVSGSQGGSAEDGRTVAVVLARTGAGAAAATVTLTASAYAD